MRLLIIFSLIIFISNVTGQTTEAPNYFCSVNDSTVEFILSSSSHSAWEPMTNCSLSQCNVDSSDNASCRSSSTSCFDYRTVNNISVCAPGILCSILESCNNITNQCASNNSVCVINSCCSPRAVCLSPTVTSFCTSAVSLLYGVQLNFDPASLSNDWSECYNNTYNTSMDSTILPTILSACNKGKLMLGCRPVGNPLLTVAAMGLRADVLYNCSTNPTCTNVANGVGWYFSYDYSWGFANNTDAVQRGQCDTLSTNAAYRLCWHTILNTGGYRCGNNTSLNDDGTFERVIYHAN